MVEPKSGLADMAGVSVDIEINGQMYKLSPLTFRDMGELHQWAYSRYQDRLYKHAENISSDKVRQAVITEAVKARDPDELEQISDSEMASVDGTIFMLWLMLKKAHKTITLGQVTDLCTDDNISFIMSKMGQLNAGVGDEVPKAPSVDQ